MIEFHYETDFRLENESHYADWVGRILISEGAVARQIDYIFCDDQYLLGINEKFLQHDTYTDIVSFDYSEQRQIAGDIFISIDRVMENAQTYKVGFQEELLRVMAHGVLHFLGYGDKVDEEVVVMREREAEKIKMFHVEQ